MDVRVSFRRMFAGMCGMGGIEFSGRDGYSGNRFRGWGRNRPAPVKWALPFPPPIPAGCLCGEFKCSPPVPMCFLCEGFRLSVASGLGVV